jgi:predicted metal-dependent hydrolase
MADYPLEYYQFFVYFNEGDYYTCHDLLEEMWLTDKGNWFLKGLLQMSVAIYHYEYGNVKGARLMMKAAHDYLQDYRPKYWSLDLEQTYVFIEKCLQLFPQEIDRVPYEEVSLLPQLPKLFINLEDD